MKLSLILGTLSLGYVAVGLAFRHYRFPREPAYVALAWPLALGLRKT